MNLLNKDLTSVDTSFPVLEKGAMRFIVAECKIEKSKKGKDMLVTTFKTKYEWKDTKGNVVQPGHPVTDRIMLEPTEKKSEEAIMKDLARFRAALTGSQAGTVMPLEQYINREVDAMIDIEEDETGEYGAQNRLRKIKPAV